MVKGKESYIWCSTMFFVVLLTVSLLTVSWNKSPKTWVLSIES